MSRWRDAGVRLRELGLVVGLVVGLGGGLAGDAAAQEPNPGDEWATAVAATQALTGNEDVGTEELEAARDNLLRLRSAALEFEKTAHVRLAEAQARLDALGAPPADGATEAPEIAQRRKEAAEAVAAAQVPVLESQDFQRAADGLIGEIDMI
ncbi:MAG: hypothetical protein KBA23_08695, partial [Amaricoccus sp.]|nr:hypothetical protein [Amaricoccus sp.]